jgi:putative Holliday junction resolvase
MRYLGIDYGAKRLGLALSDEAGGFAFPRETIPNDASSIDRIADIVHKEHVGTIVIGDTRALNGAENAVTAEADSFATTLEAHARVPVERIWEAWSSVEAARFAPSGTHDDSSAAAIILQRFLDVRHKTE